MQERKGRYDSWQQLYIKRGGQAFPGEVPWTGRRPGAVGKGWDHAVYEPRGMYSVRSAECGGAECGLSVAVKD